MYYYSSSHSSGNGILVTLIGGPMLLVWGLRKVNEKRLIENTPPSKVRSAAMGLVELSGTTHPLSPQKSPLTNLDCSWWQCFVEELRSNGKTSYWALVKQIGCNTPFYLEDATGRVLVDPAGAELHVVNKTADLNAMSRTQLAPLLNSWRINDLNWLGGEKRMRIREQSIPDCAPLFILGELVALQNDSQDSRARFNELLRRIKSDPQQMAQADLNHDGVVDADEWTILEKRLEEDFFKEELSRQEAMPNQDKMLVKAPAKGAFVIAIESERQLVRSFAWLGPLALAGGIALAALGVWWALISHWPPLLIIGALVAGFVLSLFAKLRSKFSLTGGALWG